MLFPFFFEAEGVKPVNPDELAAGQPQIVAEQALPHAIIAELQRAPITLAPSSGNTATQGGEAAVFEAENQQSAIPPLELPFGPQYISPERQRGTEITVAPTINPENITWARQNNGIADIIYVPTGTSEEKAKLRELFESTWLTQLQSSLPYFRHGFTGLNIGVWGTYDNGQPALQRPDLIMQAGKKYDGDVHPTRETIIITISLAGANNFSQDDLVMGSAYQENNVVAVQVDRGYEGRNNYASYTNEAFLFQLGQAVRHEIGHIFGLEHGHNVGEYSNQSLGIADFYLKPEGTYTQEGGFIKVDLGQLDYTSNRSEGNEVIAYVSWLTMKRIATDGQHVFLRKIGPLGGRDIYRIQYRGTIENYLDVWFQTYDETFLQQKTSQVEQSPRIPRSKVARKSNVDLSGKRIS